MPRSIWRGSISFGLVSIPAELHTAVREARSWTSWSAFARASRSIRNPRQAGGRRRSRARKGRTEEDLATPREGHVETPRDHPAHCADCSRVPRNRRRAGDVNQVQRHQRVSRRRAQGDSRHAARADFCRGRASGSSTARSSIATSSASRRFTPIAAIPARKLSASTSQLNDAKDKVAITRRDQRRRADSRRAGCLRRIRRHPRRPSRAAEGAAADRGR